MLHCRFLAPTVVTVPASNPKRSHETSQQGLRATSNNRSVTPLAPRINSINQDPEELHRSVISVERDGLSECDESAAELLFQKLRLKDPEQEPEPEPLCSAGLLDTSSYDAAESSFGSLQEVEVGDGGTDVISMDFSGQARTMTSAADVIDVVEAIREANYVTDVKMGGNTIGLDAMKAICNELAESERKTAALKCLNFDDCFTRRKEAELHPSLETLGSVVAVAHLNELALCDNALNPQGAILLAPVLSKHCMHLKVLRLDNTGIGPVGGKHLGIALVEAAKNGMRLKTFNLGRSRLENKGSISIAEALKQMGSLEVINLPQNGIRGPGTAAVAAAAVANSPQLRRLNLNDNSFGREGCSALADALPKCEFLEVLDFGDCLLRYAGFQEIGGALVENCAQLKNVDLTYNELNLRNLPTLKAMLSNKVHLQKFNLNGNIFAEESVSMIKTYITEATGHSADEIFGDEDEMEEPESDGSDLDNESESDHESESDSDEESD